MRVRPRIAAFGTVLLACTFIWPATQALADDKKTATRADLPDSTVVDQVANAIGGLAREKYTGSYAGLHVDPAGSAVTVYSTDLSAASELVEAALRSIPASTRSAVNVRTVQATHSKDELWKARAALWSGRSALESAGPTLSGISARYDGSGLTVHLDGPSDSARSLAQSTVDTTAEKLARVSVEVDWKPAPVGLSRYDDEAPYWGGSYIKNTTLGWVTSCTSAFGMAISGREYLMTADHCFDLNTTVEDGGDDLIGVANRRNIYNDALGIEVNTNRGVWVADGLYTYYIGSAWSFNGQNVCHGGYVTAVYEPICGITVTDDDIEYELEGNLRIGVEGFRCTGCVAGDRGDSGGPVLVGRSEGGAESRGILSAAADEIDGGFERIYWTETPRILGAFSGTLITTD